MPVCSSCARAGASGVMSNALTTCEVFHLHVEALVVPVDQFLDRPGQILVGGDDGNQLADVQIAADRQYAAAEIEDEGRELGEEVVDELHHELPLVEVEADEKNPRQAVGNVRALEIGAVVETDVGRPIDDLADAPRQVARRELTLQGELAQARS